MSSPQHLHATANLWSLSLSWPALAQAAQNAAGASGGDRGTVQGWRPGSGVHSGHTPNVVLDAVLRGNHDQGGGYDERLAHSSATIAWLATHLLPKKPSNVPEVITALICAVPGMRPATAGNLALYAGSEDRAIRTQLTEPDDHALLSWLRCPACDRAGSLALRASNPDPLARPVVCTGKCLCQGAGCRCGMSITVEKLPHIWDQQELAAALDAKEKPC